MLSNQFENIILEYKQDITAKKIGPPLITRFLEDAQLNPNILSPQTKKIVDALVKTEEALIHAPNPEFGGYSSNATPQDLAKPLIAISGDSVEGPFFSITWSF